MVDDNKVDMNAVNEAATKYQKTNDAIADSFKKLSLLSNKLDRSYKQSSATALQTTKRSIKAAQQTIFGWENITRAVQGNAKAVKDLDSIQSIAMKKGFKNFTLTAVATKEHSQALKILASDLKKTTEALKDLSDDYSSTASHIDEVSDKIDTLTKNIAENNLKIHEGAENSTALKAANEKLRTEISSYNDLLLESQKRQEHTKRTVAGLSHSYRQQSEELVALNYAMVDTLDKEFKISRETTKLSGGLKSVATVLTTKVQDTIIDKLRYLMSGVGITDGLSQVEDALNSVAVHARKINSISLSLGDASQVGFTRMAKSEVEAQKEISKLTSLSARYKFTSEELMSTLDSLRSSIRMDREGKLTSQALQDMTEEAAVFSRIAGVDLDKTTSMLHTRIKQFGMTAREATIDLQNMRQAITYMTASNKNNTLSMEEMVDIINSASAASQSYIVDTRIMTSALRSAVNQAENLGVAQKQAKDVAMGVGKILSETPEFIKIPAGFNLMETLLGGNATEVLDTLDANTRKQVQGLIDSIDNESLDKFVGAKAIMDLIGTTEAGLDAQSKILEDTILRGGVAAEHIASIYGIENRATAALIAKQMQEAVQQKNEFNTAIDKARDIVAKGIEGSGLSKEEYSSFLATSKKEKMTFSAALIKDMEMVNDAINKTGKADEVRILQLMKENKGLSREQATEKALSEANKSLTDTLELKGLTPKHAKLYTDQYLKGQETAKRIEEEIAKLKLDGVNLQGQAALDNHAEIKRKEQELFNETKVKNIDTLKKMRSPLEAMINDVKRAYKDSDKELSRDINKSIILDTSALLVVAASDSDDQVVDVEKLAELVGIEYSQLTPDFKDEFNRIAESGENYSGELQNLRDTFIDTSDTSKKAADSLQSGLQSPVEAIISHMQDIAGKLGFLGPLTALISGMATAIGAAFFLWQGQRIDIGKILTRMGGMSLGKRGKRGVSKRGKKGGGGGGGGGSGRGRGGGSGGGSGDGGKRKVRSAKDKVIDTSSGGDKKIPTTTKARAKKIPTKARAKRLPATIITKPKKTSKRPISMGSTVSSGLQKRRSAASMTSKGKLGKLGKLASKGAKVMGKLGKFAKAVPILGTAVAAGYAVHAAWDLFDKWREDPSSISPSDKLRMVTELASMVPGIGTAVALGDMTVDATGGYDLVDNVLAKKDAVSKYEAENLRQQSSTNISALAGVSTNFPDATKTSNNTINKSMVRPTTSVDFPSSFSTRVTQQSITPDGALTLKVQGFYDVLAEFYKEAKKSEA